VTFSNARLRVGTFTATRVIYLPLYNIVVAERYWHLEELGVTLFSQKKVLMPIVGSIRPRTSSQVH